MKGYTDKELINGIEKMDSKVLEYLYEKILPPIKQLVLQQGGQIEDVNDIVQDGMLALFRNVKSGDYQKREGTKLTTYLIQICKYRWYDILKSSRKKNNVNLEGIEFDNEEAGMQSVLEKIELHQSIHKLIDQLGHQCKSILLKYYWEEKSLLEIATDLNLEVGSVKNGKYRCMQKLRNLSTESLLFR